MDLLWLIAAILTPIAAHVPVELFLQSIRGESGVVDPPTGPRVPPLITGTFERLLAFLLVLFISDVEQVALLLIAWMGAKLASNWQRHPFDNTVRVYTVSALMAGTISLSFGVAGGLMARSVLH
jgi:hypothetical protein